MHLTFFDPTMVDLAFSFGGTSTLFELTHQGHGTCADASGLIRDLRCLDCLGHEQT